MSKRKRGFKNLDTIIFEMGPRVKRSEDDTVFACVSTTYMCLSWANEVIVPPLPSPACAYAANNNGGVLYSHCRSCWMWCACLSVYYYINHKGRFDLIQTLLEKLDLNVKPRPHVFRIWLLLFCCSQQNNNEYDPKRFWADSVSEAFVFQLLLHCSAFVLQVEKESVHTTYTENERSMLRYIYDCVLFVARKPADLYSNCDKDKHISPPSAKSPRLDTTDHQTWHEVTASNSDLIDYSSSRKKETFIYHVFCF